jgi:hypothetical protein
MRSQEAVLREIFAEAIAPLANRIDYLNQQVETLHRAIAVNYEPIISAKEAQRILSIGKDRLIEMCNGPKAPLSEGIHWRWKRAGGGGRGNRREFMRDLVLDYSIRGESDPTGHVKFCIQFHNPKTKKSA